MYEPGPIPTPLQPHMIERLVRVVHNYPVLVLRPGNIRHVKRHLRPPPISHLSGCNRRYQLPPSSSQEPPETCPLTPAGLLPLQYVQQLINTPYRVFLNAHHQSSSLSDNYSKNNIGFLNSKKFKFFFPNVCLLKREGALQLNKITLRRSALQRKCRSSPMALKPKISF